MAAQHSARLEHSSAWSVGAEADLHQRAAAMQRCAMRSMLLAMLVMALGVPLHLLSLGAHDHLAGRWTLLVVWLSAALTLLTFWVARDLLWDTWRTTRRAHLREVDLVVICAIAAAVASCPALVLPAAPMYFDVSAMALAWLVAGQAQTIEIEQRCASTLEQLAPLNLAAPRIAGQALPLASGHRAIWLGLGLLGCVTATVSLHLWWAYSPVQSILAGLALIAVACPCTLGIAASSAGLLGAERAAAAGWLVPSGAAFYEAGSEHDALLAVPLGAAEPQTLHAITHSVRRAMRRNELWAVGLNLASVPFALFGPLPALVPAAVMLIARLLIHVTNQRIGAARC